MWPERFSESGIKWVNFALVNWQKIEPYAPLNGIHNYHWSLLDNAVAMWQKRGFHIVMTLRLMNGWFAGPWNARPSLSGRE
jgi:beta-galactosidase GanA